MKADMKVDEAVWVTNQQTNKQTNEATNRQTVGPSSQVRARLCVDERKELTDDEFVDGKKATEENINN